MNKRTCLKDFLLLQTVHPTHSSITLGEMFSIGFMQDRKGGIALQLLTVWKEGDSFHRNADLFILRRAGHFINVTSKNMR